MQPPPGQLGPHELEVLDRVGDVDQAAVDAGGFETLVQQSPRRAHERAPLPVLLVAGLLAHEHHLGVPGTLAEHRLGGVRPQATAATARCRHAHALERRARRDEVGRRHLTCPW